MKNTFRNLITILLICHSVSFFAQSNTVNFTLTSDNITLSGQDISMTSTIIKNGNSLKWKQHSEGITETSTVVITSTSGDWDKNTSIGTITCHMTIGGFQSHFTLSGDGNNLTAALTFKISDTKEETYLFNSNHITY